jgi:chaperonin GroEL (HSP60 family)
VAQFLLAQEGILAVKQVKESDMEKLSRATGGSVVTTLDDLRAEDLGRAEFVEERKIEESKMVFVEGCKNPKSVAILVRGGLERMVDEAERALHDALCVTADVVKENRVVAGGGAVEAEVAKRLRSYANKVGGREQLAIEAYAEAVERIPVTLAENAGLNPIDIMVGLRAAHEKAGGQWMGVNLADGKAVDMMKRDVIEPLSVKEQALRAGTEAACMILRIDDVIASAKPSFEASKGGMPGAGGYGGY